MRFPHITFLLILFSLFGGEEIKAQSKFDKSALIITVSYGYIGCTCAQWALHKLGNKGTQTEYIYLEPASGKLINAENLVDGTHVITIKVTGHYYKEKGYTMNYNPTKGKGEPARVFRYNKIEIVN
jgi:hypothetical protein